MRQPAFMFCNHCGAANPDDAAICATCKKPVRQASAPARDPDPLDDRDTLPGLAPGTLLLSRYRLVRELGLGGMGRVYLAEDTALDDQPVAVKMLREVLSRDGAAVRRLKDEARLSMKLAHGHIVRVNHFEDAGPVKFLVMEYVEGESLKDRLDRERCLPEDDVRRIGVALCDALAHAHGKGVLHRDVKPANVLLGRDGAIKLADFGIARVAGDSMSRLTGIQTPGTVLYMAPEVVRGDAATVGSDLYSLGVTLYELASGEVPFHTVDVTHQILHRAPAPLEGVSEELCRVVARLLAKTPADRFGSIAALREELDGTAVRRRAEERARAEEEARRRTEERARIEEERRRARSEAEAWQREVERRQAEQKGRRAAEVPQRSAAAADRRHGEEADRARGQADRRALVRWIVGVVVTLAVTVAIPGYLRSRWPSAKGPYTPNPVTAPAASTAGERWRSPVDERTIVWIPPGEFLMGRTRSDRDSGGHDPQHRVTIARGFWLDATEVTNAAYQRFVEANPAWQKGWVSYQFHDGDYLKDWSATTFPAGKAEHPVVWVSWYAAWAYCAWAGKRLPTEAESEYAARAGTTTGYWWGNEFDRTRANIMMREGDTVQVGDVRRTNPWGLSDMLGNVWEWTSTLYREYPYRSDDGREQPADWSSREYDGNPRVRVIRGGPWLGQEWSLRSSSRSGAGERRSWSLLGFRCAQSATFPTETLSPAAAPPAASVAPPSTSTPAGKGSGSQTPTPPKPSSIDFREAGVPVPGASSLQASRTGASTKAAEEGSKPLARVAIQTLEGPDFKQAPVGEVKAPAPVALRRLSMQSNNITDVEAWFAAHALTLPSVDGRHAEVPDFVPRQFQGLLLIRGIRTGDRLLLLYGRNYGESPVLVAQRLDSRQFEYAVDLSNYRFAPRNVEADRPFVDQTIVWGSQIGDILYVSHGHGTYARSSFGMNGYVSAIDMRSLKALWHSAPLVSNANNFEAFGDYLITGYGFTNEPDFLFLLRRDNGDAVAKIALKSAPEYIILKQDRLYVRTYDTDYVFEILQQDPALWESIKDSRDARVFEDYLRQYPNGRFRAAAEDRLAALKGSASPAAPPVAPPGGTPAGRVASGAGPPAAPSVGDRWTSPVDGRVMVWIPPGESQMGSPASEAGRDSDEAQHQVRIDRGFWLDATEVTDTAYTQFVLAKPQWQKGRIDPRYHDGDYLKDWSGTDHPAGKAEHPVAWVSWYAARAYCGWAGKRLPTEAEWEYAARAGTTTAYWWGEQFDGARANNGRGPVAVGDARRTNPWGLSDMLGNVWEWTSSLYRPYPYRANDGRENPNATGSRVLRGGSWAGGPGDLRSANRGGDFPQDAYSVRGFRCAQ